MHYDGIQSQQWQTRPSQTQPSDAIPSSMVEPGQGVHVSMTELTGVFPLMSPANTQDFIQHILTLQVHNVLLLLLCHQYEHMYSTLCKSNSPRWSNIYPRSMKAQRYSFTLPLISVLDGGQQSTCSSLQETDPSTLSTGGWVGPRSRMHRYQKSRTHYNSPPDYTACSKSLYQLCYPSPQV